jgi:hypothetical protein
MPQIIQLPIRSFAVVKHSKTRAESTMNQLLDTADLRWAQQIRGLQVEPPEAKDIASLMIEYGVSVNWSNLWEAQFDGVNIYKMFRNKKFLLQVEKSTRDERGNLHNDTGPALVSGKDEFYFLHGLQLASDGIKWLTTPPEQLDPQEILAIRNADLRREMIRKKGIEQVLDGLFHRIIDTQGNYSLLQVMLGDNVTSACNYLKMLNPSIGCWHMEGVPNNIRTVKDALLWRNNGWFVHAEDIT